MMNKPLPFKGLNIRIPNITPLKGRGLINQGSGLCLSWQGPAKPDYENVPSLALSVVQVFVLTV